MSVGAYSYIAVPDPDHEMRGLGGGGRSSRSLDKGRGAVSPPPQFFRPFGPQFVSAFLKRWQGESLSRFSFGFMFSLMLSVSLPKCDSKFFFLCNYVIVMPNRKGTDAIDSPG